MKNGRFLLWCGAVVGMSGLVSCACVDSNQQPRIIVADSEPATFFAKPQTKRQCVSVAEDTERAENNFSVAISRGAKSCITSVKGYRNTECSGTAEEPDTSTVNHEEFFMGSINGNLDCEEAMRVEKRSPCKLYEIYSGGVSYKFCYDYGVLPPRRVAATCCINHTSPCK